MAGIMGPHAFGLLLLTSLLYFSNGDQPVEEEMITQRQVHLLGGWFPMDPQSDEVLNVTKKAVEDLNKRSRSKRYFRLLNVTSAEAQVTNEITYKIDAVVGKTKCLKSEDPDMETCAVGKKEQSQRKCKFEVTFSPRNDIYKFLVRRCKK